MTVDFTKTRDELEIIQAILDKKFGSTPNDELSVSTLIAFRYLSQAKKVPTKLIQRIFISVCIQKLHFDFKQVIDATETQSKTLQTEAVMKMVSNAFLCVSTASKYAETTDILPPMSKDIVDIAELVNVYLETLAEEYDEFLINLENHAKGEYNATYSEVKDMLHLLKSAFKQTPQ